MEAIEQAAERYSNNNYSIHNDEQNEYTAAYKAFKAGANYQSSTLYTEPEVIKLLSEYATHIMIHPNIDFGEELEDATEWFNEQKEK